MSAVPSHSLPLDACWGKWGAGDEPALPLLAHLLDTSAVALALWDVWLPPHMRELFECALMSSGRSSCCDSRVEIAWLAGSHDLGKADPIFQAQWGSLQVRRFSKHEAHLDALGLPPVTSAQMLPERTHAGWRLFRHEAVGARFLARMGVSGWAAAAVSGHHGAYMPTRDKHLSSALLQAYEGRAGNDAWESMRLALSGALCEALDVREDSWYASMHSSSFPFGATVPFLTGFIMLADWLASDETFVSRAPVELLASPRDYLVVRREEALARLPSWLGTPAAPAGDFPQIFGGRMPDRPVQQSASEDLNSRLTLVAVPMGEGKTEVALWRHAQGFDAFRDGLLFALPTMATADAMFERVRSFYESEDSSTLGHLAHGMARLNAFYSDSEAVPSGICGEGDREVGGLTPSAWFSGKHRSLLAPVTVSTCDQVLAGALSHKYLPIRLLGLASKHVILDEIHTYDPYQWRLLERLLGWLAFAGSRVTLLSATLPAQRVHSITRAWHAGLQVRHGVLPEQHQRSDDVTYPAVTTITSRGAIQVREVKAYREFQLAIRYFPVPTKEPSRARAIAREAEQIHDLHSTAAIGVLVNTVNRAVQVAQELSKLVKCDVIVLHSRMTPAQRAIVSQSIIERVGREPVHTEGCIIVGTQILEASLDLDFDFLLTDMSPAPSLFQRAGRLWRHSEPLESGAWRHPSHRSSIRARLPQPELVVAVTEEQFTMNRTSKWACAPYTQAEIDKTWIALEEGGVTRCAMPDSIQRIVDRALVSWEDYLSASEEQPSAPDEANDDYIAEHLADNATKERRAEELGVDVNRLRRWKDESWQENSQLTKLTEGTLWSEEAQTRLRETFTFNLLILDPTGKHPFAWSGQQETLYGHVKRNSLLNALSCTVPISGRLAHRLRDEFEASRDSREDMPILLRNALPIGLNELRSKGIYLDEVYGLIETSGET